MSSSSGVIPPTDRRAGDSVPTWELACPSCKQSFKVTQEMLGAVVACPHCQSQITTPTLKQVSEASAPSTDRADQTPPTTPTQANEPPRSSEANVGDPPRRPQPEPVDSLPASTAMTPPEAASEIPTLLPSIPTLDPVAESPETKAPPPANPPVAPPSAPATPPIEAVAPPVEAPSTLEQAPAVLPVDDVIAPPIAPPIADDVATPKLEDDVASPGDEPTGQDRGEETRSTKKQRKRKRRKANKSDESDAATSVEKYATTAEDEVDAVAAESVNPIDAHQESAAFDRASTPTKSDVEPSNEDSAESLLPPTAVLPADGAKSHSAAEAEVADDLLPPSARPAKEEPPAKDESTQAGPSDEVVLPDGQGGFTTSSSKFVTIDAGDQKVQVRRLDRKEKNSKRSLQSLIMYGVCIGLLAGIIIVLSLVFAE